MWKLLDFGFGNPIGSEVISDTTPSSKKPKMGIALGSGVARGWAHIGVLKRLQKEGIEPDVIAGTSIGALVGGCYLAGKLDALEDFALSLTKKRVFNLLNIAWKGGSLINSNKLVELLEEHIGETLIEDLPKKFICIGTELATGHEMWMKQGSLTDAMRASYALPGIFPPVFFEDRWLIDGAAVNPIPVSVCRSMGARLVLAVNLNRELYSAGTVIQSPRPNQTDETSKKKQGFLRKMVGPQDNAPAISSVLLAAFNISQDRLARSRMAGDPPDISIVPKYPDIGLFDFDKAYLSIEAGEDAVERSLPYIEDAMKALAL